MTITEFFHQGGYAYFVWASYGVCFALLILEIFQLRKQRRTILSRIGRLIRMRASENQQK